MVSNYPLFGEGEIDAPDPKPARRWHRVADTSRQAHEAVTPKIPARSAKALKLIREAGYRGMTNDEISLAMDLPPHSVPNITGRLIKDKLIVDSGRRRPTRLGKPSRVLVDPKWKGGQPT